MASQQRYRPITSQNFSSNFGSLDSLKVRTTCGFRSFRDQMRCTELRETPAWRAMLRVLHRFQRLGGRVASERTRATSHPATTVCVLVPFDLAVPRGPMPRNGPTTSEPFLAWCEGELPRPRLTFLPADEGRCWREAVADARPFGYWPVASAPRVLRCSR
jgi:hypothetical protein